jgi:hypothetical protein
MWIFANLDLLNNSKIKHAPLLNILEERPVTPSQKEINGKIENRFFLTDEEMAFLLVVLTLSFSVSLFFCFFAFRIDNRK